jgi:hypothetical protein
MRSVSAAEHPEYEEVAHRRYSQCSEPCSNGMELALIALPLAPETEPYRGNFQFN